MATSSLAEAEHVAVKEKTKRKGVWCGVMMCLNGVYLQGWACSSLLLVGF